MLASYGYDALSRRTGITRGNAANGVLGYDGASRLVSLTQNLAGTSQDVAFGYGHSRG